MKRVIALVCALLLLCGCSGEGSVDCHDCGERTVLGVALRNGDAICGNCFSEHGYLVCRNCGYIYDPDDCYVRDFGYCEACEEELVGVCVRCETAYLREQLGATEDGEYYLCAVCENKELKENVENLIAFIENPILAETAIDGYQKVSDESYDNGYDAGYEVGYEDGYAAGNEDGAKTGHDAGYEEGYEAGHADGREDGYRSGYDTGVGTAASVTRSSNDTKSSNSNTSSQSQSVTVYITRTGSKYHRSGCQYLSTSKISISLDDAKSRGYTACSRCW